MAFAYGLMLLIAIALLIVTIYTLMVKLMLQVLMI